MTIDTNLLNQKVAIRCLRYCYRGILSAIQKDHIELSHACAVEAAGQTFSGHAIAEKQPPLKEDPIPNELLIPLSSICFVFQPSWSQLPLPHEPGYEGEKQ